MNYLSMGILGFTAIALLFGMLVGMLRGRNRAALRLVLIVLSVALALVFRSTIVNFALDYELEGESVRQLITSSLLESGGSVPEGFTSLVFTLIEIVAGLAAFFLAFFVLRLFTWIIVFPILKIFIKKGATKGVGLGAVFGLLQGAVIALVVCAPLTGIVMQADRLSKIEFDGKPLIELPEELGISEFASSAPAKLYTTAGGWLYDAVTSAKTENGTKVSIDDTCAIVETVAGIADTATKLGSTIELVAAENATAEERIDALKELGNGLSEIGSSIESLSGDAKQMINEVIDSVKEMANTEGSDIPEEMVTLLENFSIEDVKLDSAGKAISGIASYIEKTSDEIEGADEPVTDEEIEAIVNGIADNPVILDLIKSSAEGEEELPALLEPELEYRESFERAISETSLDNESKQMLRELLGLS